MRVFLFAALLAAPAYAGQPLGPAGTVPEEPFALTENYRDDFETASILLQIDARREAVRDAAKLIDDDMTKRHVRTDLHLRQHDRIFDQTVFLNHDIGR